MEGELLRCLHGTLDSQPEVRSAAEQQLTIASQQAGFAPALVYIALRTNEVHESSRQLSLVVLKKFAKEHWDRDSAQFQAPECSEGDKVTTRQQLPRCLADPSSKVRTAAAMAIAAIATHDFPHQWPGMLEWMLQTLWEQQDSILVMGVLRCLSMLAEDIDDQQLPQLVPTLLPSLLRIMENPAYQATVHKHVLSIVHSVLAQLGFMQGAFQRQVRDLMSPLLEPWIPVLAAVLGQPLTKEGSCWALKMECLQVMVGLVTYFGKPLGAQIPGLLAACWHIFTISGPALYEELLVQGNDGAEGEAAEGDEEALGLEAMLSQMFELLLALVGNPRFSKLLKPAAAELAYVTITYMQMTHDQAEDWADNPNTYVADEEDATYTARVSGELLLDELCKAQGLPAVMTTLSVIERALATAQHTQQSQAASQPPASGSNGTPASQPKDWWKLREAGILAAGCISDSMQDALEGVGMTASSRAAKQAHAAQAAQVKAKVQALLDSMLQQDLQGPHINPFLAGRALWAAAKLSRYMTTTQVDQYLSAACTGIRGSLPPPVRIGACRALVQLLPLVDRGAAAGGGRGATPSQENLPARLAPALPALYEGLMALLEESSEETLHLVLETLAVVVKNDSTCVVQQYLAQVSSPVLRVWEGSVADPLIGEDATAVLEALAAHPQCLVPLVNQLVPALVRVISAPAQQRPMMVEASLQLLRSLMRRPAPVQTPAAREGSRGGSRTSAAGAADPAVAQHLALVQQVYVASIMPLLALIDTSDDSSVQQEAQQLLCLMIRYGRASLLSWGGAEPAATAERLVASLHHLLNPAMGELESALAGHLTADMLSAFPGEIMQSHTPKLLEAVCCRLVRINLAPLVTGLLLVLSICAHTSCHALVDALTRFNVTLPNGQSVRALDAVLPIWIDRSRDVHGRYYMALVTTALAALLESGNAHVQQVQVKGKRLDTTGGVQTRSQLAAAGGEQYTQVPAHIKLVAALAQVLADKQEAARGDVSEAGWEDDDDEDEEESDEEQEDGQGEGSPAGLAVQGSAYSPAQGKLLHTVSQSNLGQGGSGLSGMALGSGLAWAQDGLDDGGPLSPGSALHDDDAAPGADDAAPPGDPLATLDLGMWVSELFQRLALQEGGVALLQSASELAMTRKQTEAVQKLLHGSRLRAD